MPYFTLNKETDSRPIAVIKGGTYNNRLVYIIENDEDKIYENKLVINLDPKNRLNFLTNDINSMVTGRKKELIINDGKLTPLPRLDKRETLYISGPEGSGKSFYAGLYIQELKKIFPKKPFWVFSKINDDDSYDNMKPIRMKLDEELVSDPIDYTELKNSVVVFDDINTIRDKHIRKSVQNLRDEILEKGRHENIYIISITHNLTNNTETKASLTESSSVTFYPSGGDTYHINYFLRVYCGLKKSQIDKIYTLKTRWVTIYKRAPMYILYEHGCYLLSSD